MLDYLIVGQGIAGSMLSWFLLQEEKKIAVIDQYNPHSASNIASGITNPITGRKFVKTWLADEIIPFAEKTYRGIEILLGTPLLHHIPIIKLFDSVKAQNDWSVRCNSPEYQSYLCNESIIYLDRQKVKNGFGGFEINGATKLNMEELLSRYRNYLKEKRLLLEENFSFDDLHVQPDVISYKQLNAQKIIFCEGANAVQNPYFKFLPFLLAKGECLILEIDDFYPDKIINGEVFIMPVGSNRYYVGATHEWNFSDGRPSELGKNELLGNLSAMLNVPFVIKEQKAAIRPTVKDRRPFIGLHPEYPAVGIFNGMGTKGISLAPYFAKQFTAHLLYGQPLMKEVDIKKFHS